MRIASLEAFGVPPQLLQLWETALSTELLPIQEQAVVQHKVLAGKNLLVQAPTSAGKTFVGEMAATRAALSGRKVLYLVPTKALAEDKLAHFSRLYGSLGLRLIACTRDRREDDQRFVSGDFDLAIAIPEKVRALWAHGGVSQFLGLAVLDELQTLSEPERGPCLELLLAQLKHLPKVQIIGLSACLGTSARLADYLQAGWLETSERPLELRKGVLLGDEFRYREGRAGWALETFEGAGPCDGDSYAEAARLAVSFARAGEQTIVFVRDRGGAMHLAAAVAERLGSADEGADGFGGLERTAVREHLQYLLRHRVAFHSAELQFEDRRRVEDAFAAGEVDVLCATPTLSLGVNLPARNVIIDPQGWQSETAGSPSALSPITRGDYENRAGRAGRYGFGGFGRAIMLADSELSAGALSARYLEADFGTPEAALGKLPPLQAVLQLAATAASSGTTLDEAYAGTFTAALQGHSGLTEPLRAAARQCAERGVLRETPEGRFVPTVLGEVAAAAGVSFETLGWLTRWTTEAGSAPTNLEATLLAALTTEAQECSTWGLGAMQDHCETLRHVASEAGESGALLGPLLTASEWEWRVRDRAARQVLALWRWLSCEETHEVETAVRLSAARLSALGETIGWLVDTLAEIGAEQGWALADCRRLRRHAETLALGVGADGLRLARLKIFGLGRDHVRALTQGGVQSAAEALAAGAERLGKMVPPEVAEALVAALERRPERAKGGRSAADGEALTAPGRKSDRLPRRELAVTPPRATTATSAALVLQGDRPDLALFYGKSVALRPAEFRLLRALAECPGKCVRYEALYDRMWDGDRFVEPGQIYSHRSRLCGKLTEALPEQDAKQILVTVPRHGLMLNLRREEVEVS